MYKEQIKKIAKKIIKSKNIPSGVWKAISPNGNKVWYFELQDKKVKDAPKEFKFLIGKNWEQLVKWFRTQRYKYFWEDEIKNKDKYQ